MQKKDCFLIGTIFKLHGYKGNVNVYNNHNILFDFQNINYLLIEQNNTLVPLFIKNIKHTKKNIILVKFEDINSENDAKSILKRKVYLPKKSLPKKNKKEISETEELIGLKILDTNLGDLGSISYINSQTAQRLIYVNKNGKEFCFPMHKNFIIDINVTEGIMQVQIPNELINLN